MSTSATRLPIAPTSEPRQSQNRSLRHPNVIAYATCGVANCHSVLLHRSVSKNSTNDSYLRIRRALARSIRGRRADLGLSQEEFAARVGIATRHLQKLEAAEVNVTLRTLAKLGASVELPVSTRPQSEEREAQG